MIRADIAVRCEETEEDLERGEETGERRAGKAARLLGHQVLPDHVARRVVEGSEATPLQERDKAGEVAPVRGDRQGGKPPLDGEVVKEFVQQHSHGPPSHLEERVGRLLPSERRLGAVPGENESVVGER